LNTYNYRLFLASLQVDGHLVKVIVGAVDNVSVEKQGVDVGNGRDGVRGLLVPLDLANRLCRFAALVKVDDSWRDIVLVALLDKGEVGERHACKRA